MKINIAKSSGFCFGVKRAIEIAFKTAELGQKVEMLGDIVHNENVVREINNARIKKIKRLAQGKNKILLIRAHGAPKKTFIKAFNLNYKIIDATCPKVREIHRIVRESERKGYKIIIIGDKIHDEVQGISGQLKNKALIIDNIKNVPLGKINKIKKAAVVVQSTQNLENTLEIVKFLRAKIKELKFFNTICKPTQTKQKEIKTLPLENDVMLIIGSKTSANTKRLYEISKSLNKNSFWIQSKEDIKFSWFKNAQSAGITAGASTPESAIKGVVELIKKIK